MSVKELRDKEVEVLAKNLAESREELFKLRFQHATAQLEKTHRINVTKKEISRILTVIREKESGR